MVNQLPATPVANAENSQSDSNAITIDALAERLGMTVRNLREWRSLGLLPPAEMNGRVGYYGPAVVERLERVKELHSEGFTLELIRRMLDVGGDAGEDVMRLAAALRAPFREPRGATIERIGATLTGLGLSAEQILSVTTEIRGHADSIAELFEQVWLDHVWEPFISAGMPEEELATIEETLAKVQPLALDAVITVFTIAMEARIEKGIARELARASSAVQDRRVVTGRE